MADAALDEHPEYERIAAAAVRLFERRLGTHVRATVFRAAHPEYSELPNLISGVGSKVKGSRWNPPRAMRVLHTSDSPENAISEALATYRHFGLSLPRNLHIVVRAIRCEVHRVLDLREGHVRRTLRVSEERMLGARGESENHAGAEAVSQAVGRALAAAGFRGLLARSTAAPGATNTVVFVDGLGARDRITLEDTN